MLTEIGIAVTAAMTFEINAGVIVLIIIVWAAHEATAVWDVTFAHHKREVTPIEQWVHGYLSRRAIERIGAKLDGILRNTKVMPDGTLRDHCVYSIIASEWPTVRAH